MNNIMKKKILAMLQIATKYSSQVVVNKKYTYRDNNPNAKTKLKILLILSSSNSFLSIILFKFHLYQFQI